MRGLMRRERLKDKTEIFLVYLAEDEQDWNDQDWKYRIFGASNKH